MVKVFMGNFLFPWYQGQFVSPYCTVRHCTVHVGDKSVVQGSVLSCYLYLINILDIPVLFHNINHPVEQTDNCDKPTAQMFVDDILATVNKVNGKPLQETVT